MAITRVPGTSSWPHLIPGPGNAPEYPSYDCSAATVNSSTEGPLEWLLPTLSTGFPQPVLKSQVYLGGSLTFSSYCSISSATTYQLPSPTFAAKGRRLAMQGQSQRPKAPHLVVHEVLKPCARGRYKASCPLIRATFFLSSS
jgi:hypothetical protein